MKLNYLAPIAETVTLTLGTKLICASADNLTVNRDYVETYTESEFWN